MDAVASDTAEARRAWDYGAAAWDEFVESGADYYRTEVHGPALLAACGDVRGACILDVGCGQGFFSRRLASSQARVVGIDFSEQQIGNARRHEDERPLGIAYHVMDAANIGDHWPAGAFDVVTACMSLQDMPDPRRVFEGAHRLLKREGRVVFSIPNPGVDTPFRKWDWNERGEKAALKIDRYFESGPRSCAWRMTRLVYQWETPYWYRTLSEWTSLTAGAGFLIRRIDEPRPTSEQVQRNRDLDDCYRLPYFLVLELVKGW